MTNVTPAVERAADAVAVETAKVIWPEGHVGIARAALSAALTDPDDPDSVARTLFVPDSGTRSGITAEEALRWWDRAIGEDARVHWRAVADGLRMMLTGSGS